VPLPNLYTQQTLKSPMLLGSPLVSTVACEIAKTTGKAVTIQTIKPTPDQDTIAVNVTGTAAKDKQIRYF